MDHTAIIERINKEDIYKTILDLEGPKHPLDNWDALEGAASYIESHLQQFGIETHSHSFHIEGFDEPFRNILGFTGDPQKPAVLIGSHYDTVRNSPGANDNLSAVAVALEIARVTSMMDNPPTVIFAFFTLEEGHPTKSRLIEDGRKQYGWLDDKGRFTTAEKLDIHRKLSKVLRKEYRTSTLKPVPMLEAMISQNQYDLNAMELEYLRILLDVQKQPYDFNSPDWLSHFVVGSTEYAKKVVDEGIQIEYVIVYDCLGWIYQDENTQKPLPYPDDLLPMISFHRAEHQSTMGNFIVAMAERSSKTYLDRFTTHCKAPAIDLPHIGLYLPLDFKGIYDTMPDVLRSDHAPFWEAGIPGLFISDSANFRSSLYHTAEDRSCHLDYDALEKIAKASLLSVLDDQ